MGWLVISHPYLGSKREGWWCSLASSSLFSWVPPSHGMVPPTFRVHLPTSVKPLWKCIRCVQLPCLSGDPKLGQGVNKLNCHSYFTQTLMWPPYKVRLSFGSQFWRVRCILCWPQDLGTSTVSWWESKVRWGCSLYGQEAKGKKTTSRIGLHYLKTSLLDSSL